MANKTQLDFTPIFVGGSMRTGTSLLQHVLSSSSEANDMAFECHYLTDQLTIYQKWSQKGERMAADFFGSQQGLKEYTISLVLNFLKSTHHHQHKPRFLVLKQPELTPYFPFLAKVLPQAKFITSIRDPKDAVTSMLKVAEKQVRLGRSSNMVVLGRDMAALTKLFLSYYGTLHKMPKTDPSQHAFLKYEDLVLKRDILLPKLEAFTGLDLSSYDPEADWQYTRPREENKAFDTKIRGKGISDQSIGNYKEELNSKEIVIIERTAADFMKYFKYPMNDQSNASD
ncbi:sulfotransferase family protein [Sneathiella glossodoripedis]|uniref:sulfotransferase family protein n=1 Tax=Sneathiella glossodoripedis TaxID=418853 RepID=UPI000471A713|nr:sulfotransferase [Sneathiella glossodoripedis]